jgi:hypothetical protein
LQPRIFLAPHVRAHVGSPPSTGGGPGLDQHVARNELIISKGKRSRTFGVRELKFQEPYTP